MPQRLEHSPVQDTALKTQLFGEFGKRQFRIEHTAVALGTLEFELKVVVERSNTAVAEYIVLGTDTAVVAVVVIALVDTHRDSFSVAFFSKNQEDCFKLNHFPSRWPPCGELFESNSSLAFPLSIQAF